MQLSPKVLGNLFSFLAFFMGICVCLREGAGEGGRVCLWMRLQVLVALYDASNGHNGSAKQEHRQHCIGCCHSQFYLFAVPQQPHRVAHSQSNAHIACHKQVFALNPLCRDDDNKATNDNGLNTRRWHAPYGCAQTADTHRIFRGHFAYGIAQANTYPLGHNRQTICEENGWPLVCSKWN